MKLTEENPAASDPHDRERALRITGPTGPIEGPTEPILGPTEPIEGPLGPIWPDPDRPSD